MCVHTGKVFAEVSGLTAVFPQIHEGLCTELNVRTLQYKAKHLPVLPIFHNKILVKTNEWIQTFTLIIFTVYSAVNPS